MLHELANTLKSRPSSTSVHISHLLLDRPHTTYLEFLHWRDSIFDTINTVFVSIHTLADTQFALVNLDTSYSIFIFTSDTFDIDSDFNFLQWSLKITAYHTK